MLANDYFHCLDLFSDPSLHSHQKLPQRSMTVTMNSSDLQQLKENYINMIIDGMDMDSLVQFAFDSMLEELENWTKEDIVDEIMINYDEEVLESVMPTEAS